MHRQKQGSSKSHDTTYHLDVRNGDKFWIASGCNVWLWLVRRKKLNSKRHEGKDTISRNVSSSKSHFAIINEYLVLAGSALYAEIYEGGTAYLRESSKVQIRTRINC